jgi:F-type H+-transporting ATPase subunit gamma
MPTLKEIKGRISSVKNTLKITSAMKLVSSAKLRKAQRAVEAMRPYEAQLRRMLAVVSAVPSTTGVHSVHEEPEKAGSYTEKPESVHEGPTAIIAIASNSSLCGGFNANAVAKVRSVRNKGDVVYSIGRKMADAMRKDGFPSPEDFTALSERPAYSPAAALVGKLMEDLEAGRIGKVLLVYNHFESTARQTPVVEVLMGGDTLGPSGLGMTSPGTDGSTVSPGTETTVIPSEASVSPTDAILEPGAAELLAQLLPKTLKLKLYAVLLDSAAAEHAARTVAMQTATDNGEDLLDELTLQYNKGRQQKITSEILDLAGGQAADQ